MCYEYRCVTTMLILNHKSMAIKLPKRAKPQKKLQGITKTSTETPAKEDILTIIKPQKNKLKINKQKQNRTYKKYY